MQKCKNKFNDNKQNITWRIVIIYCFLKLIIVAEKIDKDYISRHLIVIAETDTILKKKPLLYTVDHALYNVILANIIKIIKVKLFY